MTPPRSDPYSHSNSRQTAQGNGCLSGFLIPPFTALCIGLLLAALSGAFDNLDFDPFVYASQGNGSVAPLFTPEVQYWAPNIIRWSAQHELDPNLAATVMQIESCGNPRAISSAGAAGLFQVMPFHFELFENPYEPDTNALRGLGYLSQTLKQANGNVRLAFAGYNGGIGVIGRNESTWAAETTRYAYWATGIYSDAAIYSSESARLNEWLNAGGASLCADAHQNLGLFP